MAKVLAVSDAESVRDWIVGICQGHGIDTIACGDPRKVYDIVADEAPDVVVMGSQIGSMGMMAITRKIKSAVRGGKIADLGVLILLDRRPDVFLARRADANAWLVNPVSPGALRWTVDTLIENPADWSEDALAAQLSGANRIAGDESSVRVAGAVALGEEARESHATST